MEKTLVLILTHKETLKNFYKKKLLTNYFKSVIINISKERKEKNHGKYYGKFRTYGRKRNCIV